MYYDINVLEYVVGMMILFDYDNNGLFFMDGNDMGYLVCYYFVCYFYMLFMLLKDDDMLMDFDGDNILIVDEILLVLV